MFHIFCFVVFLWVGGFIFRHCALRSEVKSLNLLVAGLYSLKHLKTPNVVVLVHRIIW